MYVEGREGREVKAFIRLARPVQDSFMHVQSCV